MTGMACANASSAWQAQAMIRSPVRACLPLARYNLSWTAKEELLRLLEEKKRRRLYISSPERLEVALSQPRCRFYMREFESFRESELEWKSEPFYQVPDWGRGNRNAGYKLQLGVYANGYGEARGTSVSVFVYLLQGECDDELQWPVEVDTTVQLFDQRRVKQPTHITKTISLSVCERFESSGCYSSIGFGPPQSVVQTPAAICTPSSAATPMHPASMDTPQIGEYLGCTSHVHARSAKIKEKGKRKKILGKGSDLRYAPYGPVSAPEYVKNDEAWFEVTTVTVRPYACQM